MKRERRVREAPPEELPMTPMIDVVFQLLIYFIVTIKPIDVFAHLDVSRPAPESRQQNVVLPNLIRIEIFPNGYRMNDTPVGETDLDALIGRLAALNPNQTVLIMCAALSPHERLIKVLDLCAKNKMTNLSVISTN